MNVRHILLDRQYDLTQEVVARYVVTEEWHNCYSHIEEACERIIWEQIRIPIYETRLELRK